MEVTVTKTSDGKTKVTVYNSGPGFFTEQRFRLYPPDYNGNNHIDYELSGGGASLTWEFIMEDDYPDRFIKPYPNSASGSFSVAREVRYTASYIGSTSWAEDDKQTVAYTIGSNVKTAPKVTMKLTSTEQLNGYNAVGVTALQAAFAGEAQLGASVSSYSLYVEGKSYGAPYKSDVLTQDGWLTVTGTVTDSRGFTASVSEKVWVIANMPSLNSVAGSTKYLDGAINYDFTPPSDDAYSKLLIEILVGSAYQSITTLNLGQASGKIAGNYTFTAEQLKTIYERYPAAVTAPLRFTLLSYKDAYTTQLKEQYSKEISLEIPENTSTKPKISGIACEGAPTLFNKSDIYVKGKNGVKVTSAATGQYGASIAGIVWSVESETFDNGAASDYFNSFGDLTISVTATDSRGFTGVSSKTIKVYDYSKPYVAPVANAERIIVRRALEDGSASDSGEYLLIEAGRRYTGIGGHNSCTLRYRKKVGAKGVWENYTEILATNASSNDYSEAIDAALDLQSIYYVEVSVIDGFGETDVVIFPIPTEKAYMDRSGTRNSMALGGHVTQDDAFEVYWRGYFYGGLVVEELNGESAIILTSTGDNPTKYMLTVDDDGTLSVSPAPQIFNRRVTDELS